MTTKTFGLRAFLVGVAVMVAASWLATSFYPFGFAYAIVFLALCTASVAIWIRSISLAVVSSAILGCASITFAATANNAHAISNLSKIQTGTTLQEVEAIAGPPWKIGSSPEGDWWLYGHGTWCIVTVHFNPDHFVTKVEHDH